MDPVGSENPGRLLLLLPTTTYRADAFMDAARKIDVPITVASEFPSSFENSTNPELLTLDLANPLRAVAQAKDFAIDHPVVGVLGVDDDTTFVAAHIAAELRLLGNDPVATDTVRNKRSQREALKDADLPVPWFVSAGLEEDPRELVRRISFPCVLKPVNLSASRGVIRADDENEFLAAREVLVSIVKEECAGSKRPVESEFLVEEYLPGREFAVEGLVTDGTLQPLAIFEKPDPLEGPYFEETILVTPPNLQPSDRQRLTHLVQSAASALGIGHGAVHVEVRLNESGAWLVEFHARPIGGKCSRTLRFGAEGESSLEDLLVRNALGVLSDVPERMHNAEGVMMIPIPKSGKLLDVSGVEAALGVLNVEDVVITAVKGRELVPLPRGSQYLGFIFARADTNAEVVDALRRAHGELEIKVGRTEGQMAG